MAKSHLSWSMIGKGTGAAIDVGGSKSYLSAILAESFPAFDLSYGTFPVLCLMLQIHCHKKLSDGFSSCNMISSISSPSKLMHFFFDTWSDENVIKIIRGTTSGLHHGSRVIKIDYLNPELKAMSIIQESNQVSVFRGQEDVNSI